MPSYTLSKSAAADLERIAAYTVETYGVDQAIAYRDGLIRTFKFLAEFPHAARERPESRPRVARLSLSIAPDPLSRGGRRHFHPAHPPWPRGLADGGGRLNRNPPAIATQNSPDRPYREAS
jgi:plasmid stabilization system protein ParE